MTASRKDYEAIAQAIQATITEVTPAGSLAVGSVATTAHRVADALATGNPRFDRDRFLVACGVQAVAQAPEDDITPEEWAAYFAEQYRVTGNEAYLPDAPGPDVPEDENPEDDETLFLTIVGHLPYGTFDSIVRFVGETEDGRRVTFGVDHRPAQDILAAIRSGDEPGAYVEPWQVLTVSEVTP